MIKNWAEMTAYSRRFLKDPPKKSIKEIEEETYFEFANEGKPVDKSVDDVEKEEED